MAAAASDDNALAIAAAVVGGFFAAATVVTVEEPDGAPPPAGARYPRLTDWAGAPTPRRGAAAPAATPFSLRPVATPGELWAATLFQWRVFELEADAPTGFRRGGGDPAPVELARAVYEYFARGLPNARRYENRAADEFAAGPDAALAAAPPPGGRPTIDEAALYDFRLGPAWAS